ncbi:aldo/keto reductase family protein [Haploplasma axanthum]|uniref:Glyoxal reductase n=1 Tax=Haploplasma axanthum TaxID=29552 RepID=A0A449BDM1_HAPAX|nr:aldo/keto reductase [Haploplasma axanthum]VEU80400.1 Glyoxal reductase [Haploplasma axanthum]
MKQVKLNNGILIPILGTGTNTFGKENNDYYGNITNDTKELDSAIDLGYRLIDTAISYRNESVVGLAVSKSGLDREKFFITTKIPGTEGFRTKKQVESAIQESLTNLKTDYIDLVLIHHPWDNNEEIAKVWSYLEEYVDNGVIKSIGVSNFNIDQINYLINNSRIKPVLNQIESHPGFWQDNIIEFCHKNEVAIQAWGPLSKVNDETKEVLNQIGKKYNKTWAQVILRYQIQRNVIVIPKSHRKEGQLANISVFDFVLTKEEMRIISEL